ncbi:MAG: GerMN domain-containing protein [Ilumatobacter sp.]|nr:GerMN domain-containing protein [Ilumatobacter sp.]
MRRRLVATVTALVVLTTATSCAIQEDARPRTIPEDQRGQFGATASGDAAAGTARIFLLVSSAGDQEAKLRSVLRDVPNDPEDILQSLLAGANAIEEDGGLSSVLPDDLELLSARVRGRVLTIDVTDSFDEMTPDALRLAVAQLVATGDEVEGVEKVRLRIDGNNQVWPLGDGENADRLLTVYDYPGFIESTQPPYPAFSAAS